MSNPDIHLFTIGHSTRSIEEFVAILGGHGVAALVDVRSYPASRRYPQFNKEDLSTSMASAGVEYHHSRDLGGRRRPNPDSKNTAGINPAFQGFADYMETEGFRAAIERLLAIAALKQTAIMCAESVWWRCHRSMTSDYLKAKGVAVTHILEKTRAEPHSYTAAARVVGMELSYRRLLP